MSREPARWGTAVLREGGPPADAALPATEPLRDQPGASVPSLPSLPVREVFAGLSSSPRGLTPAEAAARQARYGLNELPGVSRGHVWRRLVAQFTDLCC